jgi:RHS repeat-associated protein
VATPTFNPDGGDYAITQPRNVTISTATAGANLRYTLNGTTPSESNGTLIASSTGTVSVTPTTDGTTLQAIAFEDGMTDSDVYAATYYYEGGNAPQQASLVSNQGSVSPSYDGNGNLTSYKGWSFSYDAQNRLTSASNGAHTALFHYDGKNRQIMRSIDGVVRFSTWDDWELLEEYDTNSVRTAAYLQGAHGVIKSLLNNIYYYQDKLGSTTHIADGSGNLLESYRYDLYGTPSYFNSTSQPLNSSTYNVVDLYAGERWIVELGAYDLRNRFMSPELGRFLQADPIGFKGDASNLYRYCGNDPVDRSDPMGLDDRNYVPSWDIDTWHDVNQTWTFRNDIITVAAHGTATFIANSNMSQRAWEALKSHKTFDIPQSMKLSVKQLVSDVKALPKYTSTIPIRLNICHAGDIKGAAKYGLPAQAQQVANAFGTNPVIANTGDVNPSNNRGYGDEYSFSKDNPPYRTGGDSRDSASSERTLGAGGGEGGRRTFDAYGSTTEAAAEWEASWGDGGWLATERSAPDRNHAR